MASNRGNQVLIQYIIVILIRALFSYKYLSDKLPKEIVYAFNITIH